ncbi:Ctr86p [Sporobolomyces koalae]|uniref:Ctr86p n=1 Tax=Sporobolomyces koalae TaxID=500713 RepID=UPI0031824F0C
MATDQDADPVHLVEQLALYVSVPDRADPVQLIRPSRLALRANPPLSVTYGRTPGFFATLGTVWKLLASRFSSTTDERIVDDSVPVIQAFAAFLISLTTNNEQNQLDAITHIEPHLSKILLTASSLFNLENAGFQPMTRTCCQALANLITLNPRASSTYFPARLQAEQHDQLFQRLLATPDPATLQAILIFLLNSITANPTNALLLGTSTTGNLLIDRIMVLVSHVYDNDSERNPAPESTGSDLFGLTFAIVKQLVESSCFPETYSAHTLLPGFLVSPTLILLLKFLDGYLSLPIPPTSSFSASPISFHTTTYSKLVPFLQAQLSLLGLDLLDKQGQERERSDAIKFQAIVLILHCLCEIGLRVEELNQHVLEHESLARDESVQATVERGREGLGRSIEIVVRLLHFANESIEQPAARPKPNSSAKIHEIDPSNPASIPKPLSKSGSEHDRAGNGEVGDQDRADAGFQQLKLICVKYLAMIVFESGPTPVAQADNEVKWRRKEEIRTYQEQIRDTGGLGLVLGMCQIDGRNPTLREHALFVIRNTLKGNLENQAYIEQMKPEFKVGEDGSLQDLPPPLRPRS